MSAAERDFLKPPADQPQWNELAQNVFDRQAARWDNSTCAGGLRWQWIPANAGFDYKSTASNAFFFQLAARLARYTGNQTHFEWASTTYDWSQRTGLIDHNNIVYDGFGIERNCSSPNHIQWTYNPAAYLYGSAVMYNISDGTGIWQDRTAGLLNGFLGTLTQSLNSSSFSNSGGALVEDACEPQQNCNEDQQAYKALTARWISGTMQAAPFTRDTALRILQPSAQGAAQACTGGKDGTTCGFSWSAGHYDNISGIGEQMGAMDVFGALLENSGTPWANENTSSNATARYQAPAAPSSSSSSTISPSTASPTAASATPTQLKSAAGNVRITESAFSLSIALGLVLIM